MGSLTQSSVIDVAVGMSFLFFVLAIFASATNEAVSAVLGIRSKSLRKWLDDGIPASAQANAGAAQANAVVDAFYSHPSVNGLTRDGKAPSYIPSEHAITALLDVGAARLAAAEGEAVAGWKIVAHTAENTHALIESLPDGPIKCALLSAWVRAGGDVSAFRAIAERWFDDAMDRLSGWYKRRVQVFMWGFGLVIALTLNADAIRIAETLWRDPTVRQLVDTQAAHVTRGTPSVATASGYLHQLPLPIGWGGPGDAVPAASGLEPAASDHRHSDYVSRRRAGRSVLVRRALQARFASKHGPATDPDEDGHRHALDRDHSSAGAGNPGRRWEPAAGNPGRRGGADARRQAGG